MVSGFGAYAAHPRGSVGEGCKPCTCRLHPTASPISAAARLDIFRTSVQAEFCALSGNRSLAQSPSSFSISLPGSWASIPRKFAGATTSTRPKEMAARPAGSCWAGSFHQCHDRLLELMDYEELRRRQRELRHRGVYRGIGIATFVEQTAVGPALYGNQQVRVSAHETCRLNLDDDGGIVA